MNRTLRIAIGMSTLLLLALAAGAPSGASEAEEPAEGETAYTDADCIECHRTGSEESDLHMDVAEYEASVHGEEVSCQDCHTGVVDDDHQTTEGSGAVDCSGCHEQESRHGPENDPVACHDCHTKHDIRYTSDPASSVHPDRLPATCGTCHPEAAGDTGYFSWLPSFQIASHAKGDFGSAYEDTNCLGCHQGAGAHGEDEPINDQTCYKCHFSSDAEEALWGEPHPRADRRSQPAVFAAAWIYQAAIGAGLIALLAPFFRNRNRPAGKGAER